MRKKVDRARLFLSYDALKGFKELLQEDTTMPRKELCEDQYYELDWKIHQIQEGDTIEIVYYTGSSYSQIRGIVQTVNLNVTTYISITIKYISRISVHSSYNM